MIARAAGFVRRTHGESILAALPQARVGDGVTIRSAPGGTIAGEVVAVDRGRVTIVPFEPLAGIAVGDRVWIEPGIRRVPVGFSILGRALDPTGRALDGRADPCGSFSSAKVGRPPEPGTRRPIAAPLWTGTPAIDALLTVGRGARVGIFGAPGAGKTTLLEAIVRGASAEVTVVALIGERGREAQAWFARIARHQTIVCATSDRSASERVRAAETAMTQAEAFRARGLHALLIVDSLARFVGALRERRVSLGEPLGRGGYPSTVWTELARYLERAGTSSHGSISLVATVLHEGEDEREPLVDAARSLLDGHIVLSPELARAGRHPAIDILASASRTMSSVVSAEHARDARAVRSALGLLAETADARAVGLAAQGNERLDRAVAAASAVETLLRDPGPTCAGALLARLGAVAALLEAR